MTVKLWLGFYLMSSRWVHKSKQKRTYLRRWLLVSARAAVCTAARLPRKGG